MKINVNHPSFIAFLDQVSNNILSNITLKNYFSLSSEMKLNAQYLVLKLTKNSLKTRAKLSDEEIKEFVGILWKKSEDSENYEFASILS